MDEVSQEDATLVGSHCQYSYCNQLDFLPFHCESCRGIFCSEHRTETGHRCLKAGEWARRMHHAQLTTPSLGSSKDMREIQRPCALSNCKTIIGTSVSPSVHCTICRRDYCLKDRLKEDHNCKNLVPVGAWSGVTGSQQDQAQSVLGKLKAWGIAQKEKAAQVRRTLPKAEPTSASAKLRVVNQLKIIAKGDEKLAPDKRVYLNVEAESATTAAKYPKGAFFYSKDWVIGRVLDAAAKSLQIENVNNQSSDEKLILRVFHVEEGRLLDFGEKVGKVLVSGNSIVLLRGVGPGILDFVEL